ncbi:MAG: FkbM family methyltransferase [Granulosicoccus sp.]
MNRPITEVSTCHGNQLFAFEGDAITEEIRSQGVYDRWTLEALVDILQHIDADVCLDVGANIGNHAVVMADHCKKLYSFEPVPFIFDVLQKNLQSRSDRATAICLALSDKEQTTSITVPTEGNLGKSTMLSGQSGENIDIRSQRGDDFLELEDGHIDFIKIDVEGLEPNVIAGLQHTIEKHQPVILLEWNSEQTREGFTQLSLFKSPLAAYQPYSLTHRRSRQISGRGLSGSLRRLTIKLMDSNGWRLASFTFDNDYPNVLLVPKKWQSLVTTLPNAVLSEGV